VPFTLSHPAAVLPLRTWTPALPFTALVIGSMTPDAEYYLPFEPFPRRLTHAFVGVPTVDLVIGIVTLVLVQLILAAPLAALLPEVWGERVRAWGRTGIPRSARAAALTVVALIVGSATHVIWDSFTHINGQVVEHVPALRDQVGRYPVFQWLQLLSSVFGLVVIGVSLWRHRCWGFASLSAADRLAWRQRGWLVRAVPVLLVLSAVAFSVYRAHEFDRGAQGLRFLVITGAGEGLLIALGVWAVAYWVLSRRPPSAI
jgi:Domain of unknown function (DUF4184)